MPEFSICITQTIISGYDREREGQSKGRQIEPKTDEGRRLEREHEKKTHGFWRETHILSHISVQIYFRIVWLYPTDTNGRRLEASMHPLKRFIQ